MTDLTEMWRELERYQPYADKHGFGVEWRRMTTERTADAAYDGAAAYAIAFLEAESAGAAAEFAEFAADFSEENTAAAAEDASECKRLAIQIIRKAIEQEGEL